MSKSFFKKCPISLCWPFIVLALVVSVKCYSCWHWRKATIHDILLSNPRNYPQEIINSRVGSSEMTKGPNINTIASICASCTFPNHMRRKHLPNCVAFFTTFLPVPFHRIAASRFHSFTCWCVSSRLSSCLNGRKIIKAVLLACTLRGFQSAEIPLRQICRYYRHPLILRKRCVSLTPVNLFEHVIKSAVVEWQDRTFPHF